MSIYSSPQANDDVMGKIATGFLYDIVYFGYMYHTMIPTMFGANRPPTDSGKTSYKNDIRLSA